ncbi:hypothetical protein AbraIFM66951_007256, partial [Aspergillus brasiliensis]
MEPYKHGCRRSIRIIEKTLKTEADTEKTTTSTPKKKGRQQSALVHKRPQKKQANTGKRNPRKRGQKPQVNTPRPTSKRTTPKKTVSNETTLRKAPPRKAASQKAANTPKRGRPKRAQTQQDHKPKRPPQRARKEQVILEKQRPLATNADGCRQSERIQEIAQRAQGIANTEKQPNKEEHRHTKIRPSTKTQKKRKTPTPDPSSSIQEAQTKKRHQEQESAVPDRNIGQE